MIQKPLKIDISKNINRYVKVILDNSENKDPYCSPEIFLNNSPVLTKLTFCFVSESQKNIHICNSCFQYGSVLGLVYL